MNIFVLDRDPTKAAHMMCDKHVVKMIIESAQMLSAVLDCQYRSDRRGGDGPVIKQFSLNILAHYGLETQKKIVCG